MTISLRFVLIFLVILLAIHTFAYFLDWYVYWSVNVFLHFVGGIWGALAFFALFFHFESVHDYSHPSEKVKMMIIATGFVALLSMFWEFHLFILGQYLGIYLQQSMGEVIYGMIAALAGGALASGVLILLNNQKPAN